MTARGDADEEPLDALTPDECELLWDVFERLDHAAAQVLNPKVDGRTRPAKDLREKLRLASVEYRGLRDRIEEARKDRAFAKQNGRAVK